MGLAVTKPIILLILAIILGCGSNNLQAKVMERRLSALCPDSITAVAVEDNHFFDKPQANQIYLHLLKFRVSAAVYDCFKFKEVIPKGAIVSGVYMNDGFRCTIEWQAVYANEAHFQAGYGSLMWGKLAEPIRCNPKAKFISGSKLFINLDQNLMDKYWSGGKNGEQHKTT